MRYAALLAIVASSVLAGDYESALVRALRHPLHEVRHDAAVILARDKEASSKAVPVLIESLGNSDWYVRWQACLGLCAFGPAAKEALPALLPTLCDEQRDVCREALLALKEIAPKDEKVVSALKELFHSDHPVDMSALLFAVDAAGAAAKSIEPELVKLVEGRGPYSSRAVRILEAFAKPSADARRAIDEYHDRGKPERQTHARRRAPSRRVRRAAPKSMPFLRGREIRKLIDAWESGEKFFWHHPLDAEFAIYAVFLRWRDIQMWMPAKSDRALLDRVPKLLEAYFKKGRTSRERRAAARVLVAQLTAHYCHLRLSAIECLEVLYGTDHGYRADAPLAQREKNAEFWRSYLDLQSK